MLVLFFLRWRDWEKSLLSLRRGFKKEGIREEEGYEREETQRTDILD